MLGVPDFDGLLDYGYSEDDVEDLEIKWRKNNNEAFSLAASNAAKRYSLNYQLNKKEKQISYDEKPPINGYQLHLIKEFNKGSSEQKKALRRKVVLQRALCSEKDNFIRQYPSYKKYNYENQADYMVERAQKWLEQGQRHTALFANRYVLGLWAYVVYLPPAEAASLDPLLISVDHNPLMIQEKMTGNIFEKYCEYRSAFSTFEHFSIWRVKNRIAEFKKGISPLHESKMPSEHYYYLSNIHLPYRELLQKVLYLNSSDDEGDFNTAIHLVKNILRLSYLDKDSGQKNNIKPWIRFFEKLYRKIRFTHIYYPEDGYQGPFFLDFSTV